MNYTDEYDKVCLKRCMCEQPRRIISVFDMIAPDNSLQGRIQSKHIKTSCQCLRAHSEFRLIRPSSRACNRKSFVFREFRLKERHARPETHLCDHNSLEYPLRCKSMPRVVHIEIDAQKPEELAKFYGKRAQDTHAWW